MRDLTPQEQGDLVTHLRYVIQKVDRYALTRSSLNGSLRLHAAYDMATAVEDAKEFLTTLHLPPQPENLWQRLHSAFRPNRKKPTNSPPSSDHYQSAPQIPNSML